MKVIIFTDLDGSLLNHEDYSFSEALPSLDRIKRNFIPLIFTTSKTRREVELVQNEMGIREPAIVENGGGIIFPMGYRNPADTYDEQKDGCQDITIGTAYCRLRDFLDKNRSRFDIKGFGDMAPTEIASLTGLPVERAALAREREFTEPFIMMRPDEIDLFMDLAAEDGLRVTKGGRFHHLMGMEQDKGKAVGIVSDIFRQNADEALVTIGLGDSENDLPMLEQVDIPVLIARPQKGHLDIQLPGVIRAKECGAKGWNDIVNRLLDELNGELPGGISAGREGNI